MYVYLPEYDGEFSVMDMQEYHVDGGEAEYGPAVSCNLVLSLEGYRGHYLSADFITEARYLLEDVKLSVDEKRTLVEAYGHAITYSDHQGLHSSGKCDPKCSACEFISDDADTVERILTDHCFIVEWNDGVSVFKVGTGGK